MSTIQDLQKKLRELDFTITELIRERNMTISKVQRNKLADEIVYLSNRYNKINFELFDLLERGSN